MSAAWQDAGADVWPLVVLMLGGFGLGAWRPKAAFFAFTLSVPLLNGLPILGLAGGSPMLVFAAIWLGLVARRCIGNAESDRAGIDTLSALQLRFPLLATDILIAALLLSLGLQIWRHHLAPNFWNVFWRDTAGGYGDPHYFLSSAFIWLQGLFYFQTTASMFGARTVVGEGTRASLGKSRSSEGVRTEAKGGVRESRSHRTAISAWVRPMFLSTAVLMAFFTLIEYKFSIPENWVGVGFQSAYEDIFSFGCMAVSVFVFTITIQRKTTWFNLAVQALYCTGLLSLVIVSWSRGTWLAAATFLIVIAWFRLPRWWTMGTVLMAVLSVVIINANAKRPSWQNQIYLSRLLGLVRVEKLADKSPGRVDLYHKSIGMIRERPLAGHGIGSFYLTSPSYARKEDPEGSIPNFAHNVFLQIGAEQGVLVAGLFAALIGWVLWRGLRGWHTSAIRDRSSTFRSQPPSTERLTLLGTTLALGVYVQTNLTSNSLNIYPSNQFFFWFLMAAVLGMTQNEADNRIPTDTKETAN